MQEKTTGIDVKVRFRPHADEVYVLSVVQDFKNLINQLCECSERPLDECNLDTYSVDILNEEGEYLDD